MRGRHRHEIPTPEMQVERDVVQADHRLRQSPASRYYPVPRPPLRPDGTIDVVELCRRWDDTYNREL